MKKVVVIRDEFLRWFEEAVWDFDTARILHREGRYNAAVFYSQQCGEKAVKALLFKINESPWGHSVRELLERFHEATGRDLDEDLFICARELDRHYIPSRYPNAHPVGTPHEAYDETVSERCLKCADKILDFVRGEIFGD